MTGRASNSGTGDVAIIGVAFRFPGDIDNEQAFWAALTEGKDLVSRIGEDRWATDELQHPKRSEPGRSVTFSAGVISKAEEFDAGFFGISPREAASMDPQQRLLLELSWEAMENAGLPPARLAGSNCAVYVGISGLDYCLRNVADFAGAGMHTMTGNTLSIAANRISYAFDLRGPSAAVDTACSSSLVALHQACNALRKKEASVALVGGVNLLLHPFPFIGFTKASMISASGRCRAFDAGADGYVRAEGGAVLLLKPLAQAEKDGDSIHAVIRATAVNSDGGRKSGITIPSGEAQAELMEGALRASGIRSRDVAYVEAHGTGTPVGDPIEANAIGEVYGAGRKEPVLIGSVKTNLGHLEAASGMAGLVKVMLMLKHQAIPPSLHFTAPNPNIRLSQLNLAVAAQGSILKKGKSAQIIGVNSFGFGGTNAHALLQAYRPGSRTARKKAAARAVPPLFLSAKTPAALRALARRYADLLQNVPEGSLYDVAYSAAYFRQHLDCRLALRSANAAEASNVLERFASGENTSAIVTEEAVSGAQDVAFVYSGNGAQWAGMGRQLLRDLPEFRKIIRELDTAMRPAVGFSVMDALERNKAGADLDDTAVAQPLLFAMQVGVTMLLRRRGLEPRAVLGHSVGEVAAAWACGALSLPQAIRVIAARSRAQAKTRGAGRMAAVNMPEEAMREILARDEFRSVEIAGVNSPTSVTLAGLPGQLEALQAQAGNVFFRILDLDYAFHSRAMDPAAKALKAELSGLKASKSAVAFISTVTGDVLDGRRLGQLYWWDNVRKPVQFARGMQALIERGARIFVEIGPHAILQRYMNECALKAGASARTLPTLLRNDAGAARIEEAALRAHMARKVPDLAAYFPVRGAYRPLPNYPWQRERFVSEATVESRSVLDRRRVHPLLGWRLQDHDAAWENTIDPAELAYLADHRVGGSLVFPAAGYFEMALAAARELFPGGCQRVQDLDIVSPIVFDGDRARTVRLLFLPREGVFRIQSRERLSADKWSLNATGVLRAAPAAVAPAPVDAPAARETRIRIAAETHYALCDAIGLDYGPSFRGFAEGARTGDDIRVRFNISDALQPGISSYLLHPALLDVCLQSVVNFFSREIEAGKGRAFLPVKVGCLEFFGGGPPASFLTRIKSRSLRSIRAEVILLDAAGKTIARLEDCRFRAVMLRRTAEANPVQWRIDAVAAPHPLNCATDSIPGNDVCVAQVTELFRRPDVVTQRTNYFGECFPLLDALIMSYAYAAFCQLGQTKPAWLENALAAPESVAEERRAFFLFLKRLLAEGGLLKQADGQWRLDTSAAPPAPEAILDALFADFPEVLPTLLIIRRTGERLAEFLSGDLGVDSLSPPAGFSFDLLFSDAPAYRGMNEALPALLGFIGRAWPQNGRLRVLEIPVGDSDLSHHLRRHVAAERLDYVVAHPDPVRVERLKAECHAGAHVTATALDLDNMSLTAECRIPDTYDIIVVRHHLHRSHDAAAALENLRRLLAPGGRLILVERHPSSVADFIFGVEAAWWRGAGGRLSPSLRGTEGWRTLLEAQGFDGITPLVEPADLAVKAGAFILLARNPETPAAPALRQPANWLVLSGGGDNAKLAVEIAERLRTQGQAAMHRLVAAKQPGDGRHMARHLAAARRAMGQVDHVVFLGVAAAEAAAPGAPDQGRCLAALQLVQAMAETAGAPRPRLWIVTSGGALMTKPGTGRHIDPAAAPLWGLGRVVMNELPDLSCTLVDVACDSSTAQIVARLEREFLFPDGEREIVLAKDGRFALRMQREAHDNPAPAASARRFRLDFRVPGHLRNLAWMAQDEAQLAEDEVEVSPVAAGLNFRDVMHAIGLLPDEAFEQGFAGATLGLEFAGRVTRVGAAVRGFRAGDEVMGFGAGCFSSHVVTKETAITRKPEGWSFFAAATVPTVFFTAYYALKTLANLQPNERVLIHGAAGGVGIAAIQLARFLGAEVFATAGAPEKRDYARLLGADHVFDSRSLSFADDVLNATNGQGVDVVLNSLSGEAIAANLRVLKPFGRFLELGKRDFYENTPVGLAPFRRNISYFGIDADQLLLQRPQLAASLFREVMDLFEAGHLSPLPFRVFPAERIGDAFRHMQQARHIGKVVVNMADANVQVVGNGAVTGPAGLDADATYLVTGGLDGFGLETACWLAEQGAKNVALVSRRGGESASAAVAAARLQSLGATAHIFACDVADLSGLRSVFERIRTELPPLRGIVHAAAVFDDCLLANLDARRFADVLAPKMLGAWNLHLLTQEMQIEHFILYSSISTYVGNAGQANYVAANAYLESLAAMRQAQGLPATCINWGPIGDAGYLARNESVREHLASRFGAVPLGRRQALRHLHAILRERPVQAAVADLNLQSLEKFLPSVVGPRFDMLRRLMQGGEPAREAADIRQLIRGKTQDEVQRIVQDAIVSEVAEILRIGRDRVQLARPLQQMGMDSLMAVELAIVLEQRLGISLPTLAMSDETATIARISARIAQKLSGDGTQDPPRENIEDLVAAMATQHIGAVSAGELAEVVDDAKRHAEGRGQKVI